jgi:hypothetical protein
VGAVADDDDDLKYSQMQKLAESSAPSQSFHIMNFILFPQLILSSIL